MTATLAAQPVDRRVESLKVKSFPSRPAMAAAAADDIAAALRATLARQPEVRAIFAAAPSQADTLAALISAPGIDWHRVTAFHMDDYIGLPAGAPERFASWLDGQLFGKVPFGRVHRIVPEPDAARTASNYAELLNAAPI